MKTKSVMLQNLCAPCGCRCRYCLLSWDGKPVGIPWERGVSFARRFREELRRDLPEIRFDYSFGYSMEHPRLIEAIRELKRLSSPQAEFLQCDGMKMRDEAECAELVSALRAEGVKHLNFTFYGTEEYHDRFAGRRGDHALILRMMRAGEEAGLGLSAGIALTKESAPQAEELVGLIKARVPGAKVRLFIPHGEGRGSLIEGIRAEESDLELTPAEVRSLLNREHYRPEREWVSGGFYKEETERTLIISLRADDIERYERMTAAEIVAEAEALDEAYYAAFPPFHELAAIYGDADGKRLFGQRDLFHHYRRLYQSERGIEVRDVTDERQTGSRRS